MMPGCGPIVSALENAWGRQAKYEVGKPGIMLLEMIANDKKVGPEEILVVGDSIESDIAMAKAFGSPSVLIHDISVSKNINSNNQVIVLRALNELPALLQQMISGKGGNSE
jgi:ribonucleotide monophosphatase NagD (HAD superfamily)